MALLTGDPEVNPPVFGSAFFGAVVGDRMLLAVPLRLQPAGINAQLAKVRHDRFGPLLGQFEVRLGIPRIVGVSTELYRHLRVNLQDFSNVLALCQTFSSSEPRVELF